MNDNLVIHLALLLIGALMSLVGVILHLVLGKEGQ